MLAAPVLDQEDPARRRHRLRALRRLDVLDTLPEALFDMLTASALAMLRGETALITLIDEDRQFFKSAAGALSEMVARRRDGPLTHSFCRFVVESDDVLSIQDASRDPLLCNHPGYVENGVVAYLGAPIRVADGLPVGSLCVTGTSARIWTDAETRTLASLAGLAGELLQHRAELRTQDRLLDAVGGAPVFVTDETGRILFWSGDCERVFGWTADEAQGENAQDLLGLSSQAVAARATQHAAQGILQHRDGTHLRLSLRHTPFRTGRNVRSVAHECLGHVAIEQRREWGPHPEPRQPPASPHVTPGRRHIADALQILQSVSDVVVRQLAEQAARAHDGEHTADGAAGPPPSAGGAVDRTGPHSV